jgi:hypothetical protein
LPCADYAQIAKRFIANPCCPIPSNRLRFDGTELAGKSNGLSNRYTKLFQAHADIHTISHVHTPYVAAWARPHLRRGVAQAELEDDRAV